MVKSSLIQSINQPIIMKNITTILLLTVISLDIVSSFQYSSSSIATRRIKTNPIPTKQSSSSLFKRYSPNNNNKEGGLQKRSTKLHASGASFIFPPTLNPFVTAFFVCAVQGSAADFIAQKKSSLSTKKETITTTEEENNNNTFNDNVFCLRRNLGFLLYGGVYQGIFQEFMFNTIFPLLFGKTGGVWKKVLFDNLCVAPFLCLPMAYISKAVVFQKALLEGLRQYVYDIRYNQLLTKYWMIWFPVQCLTFTIIPENLRITFVAAFSFLWMTLLSTIAAKTKTTVTTSEA